jgi:hypothetical protein
MIIWVKANRGDAWTEYAEGVMSARAAFRIAKQIRSSVWLVKVLPLYEIPQE